MNFPKGQNNYPISEIKPLNLSIFKDETFRFLYQKSERLSVAIYLISNLMVLDEPIKWQLRQSSLNLLKSIMSLSKASLASRNISFREIGSDLSHLISLYEISYRSGFISIMNFQIIDNELKKMADFVSKIENEEFENRSALFNQDFFQKNISQVNTIKNQKDINNIGRELYRTSIIKDSLSKRQYGNMSFIKKTPDLSKTLDNSLISLDRNKRREKILSIIRQKDNVSVKDITKILKDISEKTIQRELISMVESGVLLKEGERRWSRYSLNKDDLKE